MQPESICKQLAPQLDAYHDGELVGEEKETVEKHLGTCAYCVSKLAEIDLVVHSLKTIPLKPMPEGLSAKLDGMIDAASKGTVRGAGNVRNFPSRVFIPMAAAAAAVVALVVGINFFNGQGSTPVAHVDKPNAPQVADNPAVPQQIKPQPAIQHEVATQPERPVIAERTVVPEHASPTAAVTHPGAQVALLTPQHQQPHAKSVARATQPQQQIASSNEAGTTEVAVAELPSGTNSFNEAVGIATDEDGLYDIKM